MKQNFELIQSEFVTEYQTEANLWQHKKTGAQVLMLENDDENKVFCISFKTPSANSTGIAHILEHSVLCGSRKFPTKEPFVQLLQSSLNTFLNAFTWPDKTVYPVASTNSQDFYNLAEVYLDAVFFPKIDENIFRQEGWHLELENDKLTYKGVVYNEMRGAYSNPEREIYETAAFSLFPDNIYAFDSGGNPEIIPHLTYWQFKNFHQTFYHPTNAKIFFYGNDRSDKRFEILEEYLSQFERQDDVEQKTRIELQKPFDQPKVIEQKIFGEGNAVTCNWVCGLGTDDKLRLEMYILGQILLGNPAAILYRTLLESGLGQEVWGGNLDVLSEMFDPTLQPFFSAGLKGVAKENMQVVANLIEQTLQNLSQKIPEQTVNAAINAIEFKLRENESEYPQGLSLIFQILKSWNYGGNPINALKFEENLNLIRQEYTQNPQKFSRLIDQYLIQNPHRNTIFLIADKNLNKQRQQKITDELDILQSQMDQQEMINLQQQLEQFQKWQQQPDKAEDLAKIPRLQLSDLNPEQSIIPRQVLKLN